MHAREIIGHHGLIGQVGRVGEQRLDLVADDKAFTVVDGREIGDELAGAGREYVARAGCFSRRLEVLRLTQVEIHANELRAAQIFDDDRVRTRAWYDESAQVAIQFVSLN